MNQRRKATNQNGAEDEDQANGTSTQIADQAQKSKIRNKNSQSTRDAWKASKSDGSALDVNSLPDEIVLERAKRPKANGDVNRRTSYTIKAPGTPFHELDLSEIPWLHHDAAEENNKRGYMRYRRLFFIAGILAGAILAYALSHHVVLESHIQNLRGVIDEQLSDIGINLSSLDLSSFSIPSELAQLGNDLFSVPRKWGENGDFTIAVGERLRQEGLKVKHPVVLLPGIVSTGLESWSTEPGVFRKRLWGSMSMVRTIATQKEMWIRQLSLDPSTGLDPPGIKVRPAEGLDAASYFVSGYWIWDPIIRALAVIGYDPNNLSLASYDWRLSFHNLEVRDRVFSRLKLHFEQNLFLTGKKSVLVAHSMGSTVALYFMKWVEAEGPGYGNGGPDWVDKHIESFVSIAGTFLGVPKAMAALLSGEMRDTVELPPAAAYLLEKFFSRRERAKLFQTWAGSASMLIKGGNAVWGNETWAPDDEPGSSVDQSHGKVYSFKLPEGAPYQGAGDAAHPIGGSADVHETSTQHILPSNLSASDAYNWLLQHTPSTFQQMVRQNYSDGIEYSEEQIKKNNQIEKTWANPLEAALPNAPNMKLHCIYGVGKQTERSYWYTQGPYERDEFIAEGEGATCLDCGNQTSSTPLDFPTSRTSWIDTSIHDEKSTPQVRSGVKFSDGDGTVSVQSLGAMCVEGWKRKRYNPAGIKVYTHEIAHEPEPLDLRGGSTTGDHVDILGSFKVNEIVLRVAAGLGHTVNESFFSNEREYAKNIAWDAPPA